MSDGAPVSIGDVLAQLRDEFPDVTISKIRFLESQGLLVPDRTPSGYRKFSGGDVERLRWILRQQKDHFLPLKVIKERLEEFDRTGVQPGDGTVAHGAPALFDDEPAAAPPEVEPAPEPRPRKPPRKGSRGARSQPTAAAATTDAVPAPPAAAPADPLNALVVDDGPPDDMLAAPSGVSLTRTELARAAELTDDELIQLEEYGLVMPAHRSRDRVLFDDDALEVARIAAAFMRHGVEPRHLRMYRAFADREAGLFEQVLLPFRKRRNPAAQEKGEATLRELAHLGRGLRTALLRQAVRRSDAL